VRIDDLAVLSLEQLLAQRDRVERALEIVRDDGEDLLARAHLVARQVVEPGVLDRHRGVLGEELEDRHIIVGERAAARPLGEVEVAHRLVALSDRDSEQWPDRHVRRW
jgi:hypothetical protein